MNRILFIYAVCVTVAYVRELIRPTIPFVPIEETRRFMRQQFDNGAKSVTIHINNPKFGATTRMRSDDV